MSNNTKPLFTTGSTDPYIPPEWIDNNCTVSTLRGRMKANIEFAKQSTPDSMEYFTCMQRVAHLERAINERENDNAD